jgi:hypothetical protein
MSSACQTSTNWPSHARKISWPLIVMGRPVGGQAEEVEWSGVGAGHRPPACHQVVLFERHIEYEMKVGKGFAYCTGGPKIALPAGGLAGERVVVDQVLVDQFAGRCFVSLAPDLVQPALISLDKHLGILPQQYTQR